MAYKDLHDKPFEENTIAKLEIFEDYAQAWIPTFVMQNVSSICIFDFFAGTGYDKNGVAGSPIRILDKIKEQVISIFQRKVKVRVFLNEFNTEKFELLKKSCEEYLKINDYVGQAIEINYFNEDFENLFHKLLPIIKDFPSLVYLDQNGIKFLSEKYILELEKMRQTDFLYFASASYLWRFGDSREFKAHLDVEMSEVKSEPYRFVHRSFINQLKKKLPLNTQLKLYPFSLKKGANIYGIIFGASHPLAVDKFLRIAWKRNEINGEANFDIDDDNLKKQRSLFGNQPLTKIEAFQENVRNKILNKEIVDNFQLFGFVLEEGHLPKHATEILRKMKSEGEIWFDGKFPLITYENVYSIKRKISYLVLKK
ncbi:MAG: three-Cys-motif partner protein TcmP [Acidobacteria bacterium]|nr:three-Cys-motif partner protein TcmP [Acidobacteriota bacterium]